MNSALLLARCAASHRVSGGGGGGSSHVYWRLYVTAVQDGGTRTQIATMDLLDNTNTNIATGGTASSSSSYSSTYLPGNLFDGNDSTLWISAAGGGMPQWAEYQLPSAQEVISVALVSRNIDAHPEMVKDFLIQYSDDGSTWTTAKTVTGEPSWGANERRVYTL